MARIKIPLNTAMGDRELCAWQPVRGIVWVQTRSPKHAKRLAKRKDGRVVAIGVAGGFLRTFEFAKPLSWALRLMKRYTAAEKAANEALGRAICSETNLDSAKGRLGMAVAARTAVFDKVPQVEVVSVGGATIYA